MGEVRTLPLAAITAAADIQPRAAMSPDLVAEYAAALADGAEFPPVILFRDAAGVHWLVDGFHRYHAALVAGIEALACEVRPGSKRDAALHAVGANATHGLRRTNLDKRRAVLRMLDDAEWQGWSDREIARQCAVSHPFVAEVRARHLEAFPDGQAGMVRTVERGGTRYAMRTGHIGSRATGWPVPSGSGAGELDGFAFEAAEAFIAGYMPVLLEVERGILAMRDRGQAELARRGYATIEDYLRAGGEGLVALWDMLVALRAGDDEAAIAAIERGLATVRTEGEAARVSPAMDSATAPLAAESTP